MSAIVLILSSPAMAWKDTTKVRLSIKIGKNDFNFFIVLIPPYMIDCKFIFISVSVCLKFATLTFAIKDQEIRSGNHSNENFLRIPLLD
jgi:hypothetical protein